MGGAQAEEEIFDHLHATAFQYTPLGRYSKKDIQDYISTHYAAHVMVISASGIKDEDVVEQVKKMLTKLSANPVTATQLVEKETAIFTLNR